MHSRSTLSGIKLLPKNQTGSEANIFLVIPSPTGTMFKTIYFWFGNIVVYVAILNSISGLNPITKYKNSVVQLFLYMLYFDICAAIISLVQS